MAGGFRDLLQRQRVWCFTRWNDCSALAQQQDHTQGPVPLSGNPCGGPDQGQNCLSRTQVDRRGRSDATGEAWQTRCLEGSRSAAVAPVMHSALQGSSGRGGQEACRRLVCGQIGGGIVFTLFLPRAHQVTSDRLPLLGSWLNIRRLLSSRSLVRVQQGALPSRLGSQLAIQLAGSHLRRTSPGAGPAGNGRRGPVEPGLHPSAEFSLESQGKKKLRCPKPS